MTTRTYYRWSTTDPVAACKQAARKSSDDGGTYYVVKTIDLDPPLFTVTDEPTVDDPSHTVTWIAGEDPDFVSDMASAAEQIREERESA